MRTRRLGGNAQRFRHFRDEGIPQKEAIVASVTEEYGRYKDYRGPTGLPRGGGDRPDRPRPTRRPRPPQDRCSYWQEEINHQGVAAFNDNPDYRVFRNVRDYGAVGDGVTDDTAGKTWNSGC